ncbi:MAG: glycosyltransferase family 2 protein [Saprospiraceae bacterium]
MKKVGVLILNYLSYQDTINCVENLLNQQGIILSVLIIDNHSPNASYSTLLEQFAHRPTVKVIQTDRNGGYAYGNNFGLRYLEPEDLDFIVISNNDIQLSDPFLIKSLIETYPTLDKAAFLAPAMFVDGQEDQKHQAWRLPTFRDEVLASLRLCYFIGHRFFTTNRYHFPPTARSPMAVDCLSGSFFLGSKKLFYELDLFDENTFLYGEETILGHRVKARGLQSYLWRARHYHHTQGKTTKSLHSLLQLQRYWLESSCYYQRHYRQIAPWKLRLLKVLYYVWVLETYLLQVIRKENS